MVANFSGSEPAEQLHAVTIDCPHRYPSYEASVSIVKRSQARPGGVRVFRVSLLHQGRPLRGRLPAAWCARPGRPPRAPFGPLRRRRPGTSGRQAAGTTEGPPRSFVPTAPDITLGALVARASLQRQVWSLCRPTRLGPSRRDLRRSFRTMSPGCGPYDDRAGKRSDRKRRRGMHWMHDAVPLLSALTGHVPS